MPASTTTLPPRAATDRAIGPAFVHRLRRHGDRSALVTARGGLSYEELADAVEAMCRRLGPERRLVVLPAHSSTGTVIALLAALSGGHPVMLVPPCGADAVVADYEPDVIFRDGEPTTTARSAPHDLHPDLALCLTTSGATGSTKLVRLSARNLDSNADAVAQSLGLTCDDRGITALSMGYSYGLSVLTSHLAVGASLVVTDSPVTDDSFWEQMARHCVTTLPAVPYSLELMVRAGLMDRSLPALRLVTCAGGALPAERALELDRAGRRRGWGISPMYGQTEATARISCLPASLVADHPGSVGRAVPGGRLTIADADEDGVGEIVYQGPNVMMGYATSPADLAAGAGTGILRTGDLGRIGIDGLLHVVGRLSRIAKVRGLRIALDDVDRALGAAGIESCTVALDEGIAVATTSADLDSCRRIAAQACSLPQGLVTVVSIDSVPRTESGKVRSGEVLAHVRAVAGREPAHDGESTTQAGPLARLQAAYSTLLATSAGPGDSFTSLGGDSLSYVEVSLAVEEVLGHLPPDWNEQTLEQLASSVSPPAARWWRTVEGTVAIRATAIALVVGSHAQAFDIRGGAHVLMALVGFNIARFHLRMPDLRERTRRMWRSTARLLIPAEIFLLALVLAGAYDWTVLGVNFLVNPEQMGPEWRYWFVESLLWILPAAVLLLSVPAVDRVRRRYPFGFPLALAGALFLAGRLLGPQEYPASVFSPLVIAWMAALGWTIAAARSMRQRVALSVMIVSLVPWTLYGVRMIVVPLGLLALIWLTRLRLPTLVALLAVAVAQASLVIYLLHWPVLDLVRGWTGAVLGCAAGVAASWALARALRKLPAAARGVGIHTNR